MKPFAAVLLVAFLTLTLVPSASAIIICDACTAFDPPHTRCIGTCQGQSYRYCGDWIADGCPTLQFAQGTSEGLLQASCEAPVPPVETAPAEVVLPEPAPVVDGVEPLSFD